MFRQKSYGSGGFKRSSFGSSNSNSRSNYSRPGSRPSFGARRVRKSGNTGNSHKGQFINPEKFINKAVKKEEEICYKAEHKFSDFKVCEELAQAVVRRGFNIPTPIQDQTILPIMQGKDVVGIANTGTGKTAAFLIPLINKVVANPKERVLILVPTHELAIQIQGEFRNLASRLKLRSACLVGGASMYRQISEVMSRPNFIIGTPGRTKDIVNRNLLRLNEFNSVVLDEADRMLDMGFIADIRFLLGWTPRSRQTLFFSATMSSDIEQIVKEFLKSDLVKVSVKTRDTSENIDQDVVRITSGNSKLFVLNNLLKQEDFKKVLVFGRTKHGVKRLSETLVQNGFKSDSIHGDKNHMARTRAISSFKEDRIQILVATDVAARGLDIANVSHVINYDLPATYDDYVHRIGRTGRGNMKGKALTFIES